MDLTPRQGEFADAALRVLTREGMARVSFRTVAAEAGMSLGSVQKAFPTKSAMLSAMLTRMRTAAPGAALAEPGRPTLHAWLTALTLSTLPLDAERRAFQLQAGAFADQATHDPELAAVLADGDDELLAALTGLVARATPQGEAPRDASPAVVARGWLALTQGLATQLLYAPRDEAVVQPEVEALVRMLLSGAGPASPPAG